MKCSLGGKKSVVGLSSKPFLYLLLSFNNIYILAPNLHVFITHPLINIILNMEINLGDFQLSHWPPTYVDSAHMLFLNQVHNSLNLLELAPDKVCTFNPTVPHTPCI